MQKQSFSFLLLILSVTAFGQLRTIVSGKVIEAETATPIPFANVIFRGTSVGAITDFDGNFRVETDLPVDSLEVRYIGYLSKTKAVYVGQSQIVNFQLTDDVQTLGEVIIYSGENPAFPILRNVVAAKEMNDKRSLDAFDYEIYTKIEIDLENLTDKMRNTAMIKKASQVLDSIEVIVGEDGQPVMPIFFSETLSRFYFRNDPRLTHEHILKTKVLGVGLTDGTTTAQIIGATFQEYNFYWNWLTILDKSFVSPISDGWKLYYDYDLVDSLMIEDDFCYRIEFTPKSSQDLAFTGTMWITKEHFALKRIDATINSNANLNFIDKIKVQQDLVKTDAGPWVQEKSRVVVDVAQLTPNTAGILAKFYTSVKDIEVNDLKPLQFYQLPVKLDDLAMSYDDHFWDTNRHDSLSTTEKNVYKMVDTLKQIPVIKHAMNAAKFGATGYLKVGKFDFGPYYTFYGDNVVEGVRLGMGIRTSYDMSKDWVVGGYVGFGLGDQRWKYQVYGKYVFTKDHWTELEYSHQKEIDQVWSLNRNVSANSLFYSLSRFGNLYNPFLYIKDRVALFRQYTPTWSQRLAVKRQSFSPLYEFSFKPDPNGSEVLTDFSTVEVTLTTRFAKGEIFIVNDYEHVSMGTIKWPTITFNYSIGKSGIWGSDLDYQRFQLEMSHRQNMSFLGVSRINLEAGKVIGHVPYPLLYNPIGNETFVYAPFAFNLMKYFEFSSDTYILMRYRHSSEGLILNKVPLMKKLKWRLVANANMIYGSISDSNVQLVAYPKDTNGDDIKPFTTLSRKPYVELGYGVENIFKFFRVDAFHRITYLDQPNIDKFGLKFSMQFIL